MEIALAALPGAITTCLLLYVLLKVMERQQEERVAHRIEVDRLTTAHAEQVDGLLQRIQAPQVAIAEHAAEHFPADPPQIDLDDDLALIAQREAEMDRLARDLSQ